MSDISQDLVKELFTYKNGLLIRNIDKGRKAKSGDVAGYLDAKGYVIVKLNGRPYKVHRLIWLYHYGHLPDAFIDHINGTPSDNRIENLRLATRSQNSSNSKLSVKNSSGCKGVSNVNGSWRAVIEVNGRKIQLGSFKDKEYACKVYKDAALFYFGEYARFE